MSDPFTRGPGERIEASRPRRWLNRALSRDTTAWVLLILTVTVTVVAARLSEEDLTRRTRQRFLSLAAREIEVIVQRMRDYEQVLRGGAALMYASDRVTREAWREYVAALELERILPGIQGTGFSLMVPRASRSAHEQEVRAEGFPDYAIRPPGDRDPYSSIVYLEPFTDRNLRAFGYDMYSEPVRREAMDRARDTGEAALSGKVTLVQETGTDIQYGFLVYFPVYRGGGVPATLERRRSELLGFVYSPFRAGDLMNAIFRDPAKDLEIELFDGEPSPQGLLFASESGGRDARLRTEIPVVVAGRAWTARFHSSAQFEQRSSSSQPALILFGGLALDGMLFLVLLGNAHHRRATRRSARALEHSRDSYVTLMENVPGTVFRLRVGRPSRIEHLSHGIVALTGEPPERFVSGALRYADLVHPDDRARVRQTVGAAIAERRAYDVEYRIESPRGGARWVGERGRASLDETGELVRVDGVLLDITAGKQAEIRIAEAMRAAEAANAAKSAFLANMSHEIRTPLNAILGLAQVLERSAAGGEELDIAHRIRTAGGVLLRSLNDVLDFSKIEAGQLDIEQRPFPLAMALDNLASLMSASARAKGLRLRVDAAEARGLRLIGDAVRLEQILLNLVGNAIKFTARGEVAVLVAIESRAGDAVRLRFEVTDQGIGIAADKLPLLFTPFTQADESITRRFGGTGLGLSICKRLVELMGGEIGVRSREGEGSTFWFALPFETVSGAGHGAVDEIGAPAETGTPGAPASSASPVSSVSADRLAGLRILVADDSETNLDLFARLLSLEGASATLASDGRQVLELLGVQPDGFDAVLMDLQMPVLDGLAATHEIRGVMGLVELPVIACSAGALADDAERARAAGVNDFVTKPVDHEQLVAVLVRWTRSGRGRSPPDGAGGTSAGSSDGPHAPDEAHAADAATAGGVPRSQPDHDASLPFPEIDGIDRERVERLFRGDFAFFLKTLCRFRRDSMALPQSLRQMLEGGDPASAAAALHKLRGTAGHLGATRLAERARALETAIRAGEAVAPSRLAPVAAELEALLNVAAPWCDGSSAVNRMPARAPTLVPEPPPVVAAAASARRTAFVDPENTSQTHRVSVDPEALDALRDALTARRLSAARKRYDALAPTLSAALGPERFDELELAMDALRFEAALAVLEELR